MGPTDLLNCYQHLTTERNGFYHSHVHVIESNKQTSPWDLRKGPSQVLPRPAKCLDRLWTRDCVLLQHCFSDLPRCGARMDTVLMSSEGLLTCPLTAALHLPVSGGAIPRGSCPVLTLSVCPSPTPLISWCRPQLHVAYFRGMSSSQKVYLAFNTTAAPLGLPEGIIRYAFLLIFKA